MLAHPKANALSVELRGTVVESARARQRGAGAALLYPDFDDPLRQAMRTEVEMLFDAIVREDRPITELLTADYTFVNERLAAHYGIPNIYGSQFRRITLGPGMDDAARPARQGGHPDDDLEARPDVAGHARQVDHDEPVRHEPARSSAQRSSAAGARHRRRAAPRTSRRCARRCSSIACAPTACSATG